MIKDWNYYIDSNLLISTLNKIFPVKDKICPHWEDIFKALNYCQPDTLKVVMIGQDPYPQKDVATGILFGNNSIVSEDKLSPSLKVVKSSVLNLVETNKRTIFDQTMEDWEKQGILMINAALTCEINKICSHMMIWRPFISSLLESITKDKDNLVFILFGSTAQTFENHIKGNNLILKIEHPAYFARTNKEMPNDIFIKTNEYLKLNNKIPIEWYKCLT